MNLPKTNSKVRQMAHYGFNFLWLFTKDGGNTRLDPDYRALLDLFLENRILRRHESG